MLDLSISVVCVEVLPVHPWTASRYRWKVARISGGKRLAIEGVEDSMGKARKAAADQCAVLVRWDLTQAGEE